MVVDASVLAYFQFRIASRSPVLHDACCITEGGLRHREIARGPRFDKCKSSDEKKISEEHERSRALIQQQAGREGERMKDRRRGERERGEEEAKER